MDNFLVNLNSHPDLIYVLLRSLVLFFIGIIILRFGNRRYNLNTPFDYLFIIINGGLISRGINGSATLISTLVALITLIICHRLIAIVTCHFELWERFFMGTPRLLIKDGKFLDHNLIQFHLTKNDLLAEMRHQVQIDDLSEIKAAYLEGRGFLTFVKKTKEKN